MWQCRCKYNLQPLLNNLLKSNSSQLCLHLLRCLTNFYLLFSYQNVQFYTVKRTKSLTFMWSYTLGLNI